MSIPIDPPMVLRASTALVHLVSDASLEELHDFARVVGILSRGFERDHYDVPGSSTTGWSRRALVPVSSRELVSRLVGAGLRRRKSES